MERKLPLMARDTVSGPSNASRGKLADPPRIHSQEFGFRPRRSGRNTLRAPSQSQSGTGSWKVRLSKGSCEALEIWKWGQFRPPEQLALKFAQEKEMLREQFPEGTLNVLPHSFGTTPNKTLTDSENA
uniref:Uncharacterized protein n=1 Tax=Sphaerodactylus townsendi TaxID=933632 RepID=A0ACB8F916_9SAUR